MAPSLLAAWLILGTTAAAQPADGTLPQPAAYHVGSFGSMLAARLDLAGRFDTGSAVLQLVDGATGLPLELSDVGYGKGPILVVGFTSRLGPVDVEGVCLASPETVSEDRRLVTCVQVKLTNATTEPQQVELVGTLAPGGGDPERRPHPSLPFASDVVFAAEEGLVTRDGLAIVSWVGQAPEVELTPEPAGPEDRVAALTWAFDLAPGEKRFIELKLPGPPTGRPADNGPSDDGPTNDRPTGDVPLVVAEEDFRANLRRVTFVRKEEKLRWQWQFRGAFAEFRCAEPAFWRALVGNAFFLRSLGVAQFAIGELSDRPYGHPATDAAIEAEIVGIFIELGMDAIGVPYLDRLIEELPQRTLSLTPERQLAYVHGLARAVRLSPPGDRDIVLANAILAFVNQPLAVEPWLDPAIVRQDLGTILETAGLGDASLLPELLWATVADPDSAEGEMQAMRRAISARDPAAAWSACQALLARATQTGMAPMVPGGELDGRYSMGMLTLQRALIFDDHGPDLVLFPALSYGLIEQHSDVDSSLLPTRFGLMRAQIFFTSQRMFGAWLQYTPTTPAQRMLVQLPGGTVANRLHGEPTGGTAEIIEEGRLAAVVPKAGYPRGMRFVMRLRNTE